VLYGDSHALHWILTFALMGRKYHWRIEALGQAARHAAGASDQELAEAKAPVTAGGAA